MIDLSGTETVTTGDVMDEECHAAAENHEITLIFREMLALSKAKEPVLRDVMDHVRSKT